jgi:hypothetical protein
VPCDAQYYYIPEIDGYYDLYAQQYLVAQDGYWVPLPELYGYDPYQFHPVVIAYHGREPWRQLDYYHARYAYRPYHAYGPEHRGYYRGGYGQPGSPRGYGRRSGYCDNRGYDNRRYENYYYGSRNQNPYSGGRSGYSNGQPQASSPGPSERGGYNRGNYSAPGSSPSPIRPSQQGAGYAPGNERSRSRGRSN